MSTPGHMISASIISLIVAKVSPSQTNLVYIAILFSGIVDIDHVVMLAKNRTLFKKIGFRGTLHHARSIFHELAGVLLIGIASLFISYFTGHQTALVIFLSYVTHLSQDFILGKSFPFQPFDNTEISLFSFSIRNKIIIEGIVVVISGLAWIQYLHA